MSTHDQVLCYESNNYECNIGNKSKLITVYGKFTALIFSTLLFHTLYSKGALDDFNIPLFPKMRFLYHQKRDIFKDYACSILLWTFLSFHFFLSRLYKIAVIRHDFDTIHHYYLSGENFRSLCSEKLTENYINCDIYV